MNEYYSGEPVNIYTIFNKCDVIEKLGNYNQKRVRVNCHNFRGNGEQVITIYGCF